MPIYEYQCVDCRHDFEAIVQRGAAPACPSCESRSLQKRLSAFAVGRPGDSVTEPLTPACGTCGDPRGAGACSMN